MRTANHDQDRMWGSCLFGAWPLGDGCGRWGDSVLSVPGHVFISYRHGDNVPYLERLTDYLTSEGVSVWFDREIVAGDRWDHVIRSKIDTCTALVVVMTPQAEKSDWVAREIDQAQLMNKPIFPLLLEGRRFFRLSNLQYEDVTGARMPKPSFVARLRAISAAPSSAAEPVAEPATEGSRYQGGIAGYSNGKFHTTSNSTLGDVSSNRSGSGFRLKIGLMVGVVALLSVLVVVVAAKTSVIKNSYTGEDSNPAIQVDPSNGYAGTNITVEGHRFSPGSQVTVCVGVTPIKTVDVTGNGDFSTVIKLPYPYSGPVSEVVYNMPVDIRVEPGLPEVFCSIDSPKVVFTMTRDVGGR